MQIVPSGSNGPQISKKVSGYKDLTQINNLPLKLVINEKFELKNKQQTQKKNAKMR